MAISKEVADALIKATNSWIVARRNGDGSVNPGVLATALAVTSHLRKSFPLAADVVATDSQVKGQSGGTIGKVLAAFGENRKLLSEAGRTSRGSREAGIALGAELSSVGQLVGFAGLGDADRASAIDALQGWLVGLLGPEFFDRQRIQAELIDPSKPVRFAVAAIIEAAIARGGNAAGAVAQHLVGAKLTLRFPNVQIGRDSYTTADQQTARAGDFQVGDSAFHVTMSPSEQLFSKRCVQNIVDGFRPIVIVPESRVVAAQQLASIAGIDGKVDVLSLELFVGLNVEEMAWFASKDIRTGLRVLLEEYNERVRSIESNLSLQIEIPVNL